MTAAGAGAGAGTKFDRRLSPRRLALRSSFSGVGVPEGSTAGKGAALETARAAVRSLGPGLALGVPICPEPPGAHRGAARAVARHCLWGAVTMLTCHQHSAQPCYRRRRPGWDNSSRIRVRVRV